jgi:hypothetical protein
MNGACVIHDVEIAMWGITSEDVATGLQDGTFDCIMVQPVLQGEAIFKQQGELWVWLTDDERKIPVQMKSKVAVGSITTELIKIEGVPLPLRAQVK